MGRSDGDTDTGTELLTGTSILGRLSNGPSVGVNVKRGLALPAVAALALALLKARGTRAPGLGPQRGLALPAVAALAARGTRAPGLGPPMVNTDGDESTNAERGTAGDRVTALWRMAGAKGAGMAMVPNAEYRDVVDGVRDKGGSPGATMARDANNAAGELP